MRDCALAEIGASKTVGLCFALGPEVSNKTSNKASNKKMDERDMYLCLLEKFEMKHLDRSASPAPSVLGFSRPKRSKRRHDHAVGAVHRRHLIQLAISISEQAESVGRQRHKDLAASR